MEDAVCLSAGFAGPDTDPAGILRQYQDQHRLRTACEPPVFRCNHVK